MDLTPLVLKHHDALLELSSRLTSPDLLVPDSTATTLDLPAPTPTSPTTTATTARSSHNQKSLHKVSRYTEYDPVGVSQRHLRRWHVASIISDHALLFRFYNKQKFSLANAETYLVAHIKWRIQNNLPSLCFSALSTKAQEYASDGIFRFFGQDKLGRPCAILDLSKYDATKGKKHMEDFREYLIYILEILRRCVVAVNDTIRAEEEEESGKVGKRKSSVKVHIESDGESSDDDDQGIGFSRKGNFGVGGGSDVPRKKWRVPKGDGNKGIFVVQSCVIIDLAQVSMGNLNYELIPLLYELFHRQYPQVFGTVYVLNYGWIHAGVWSIIKTALPADACKKLMFLTKQQLLEHFDRDELLT
ncbi:hypothetical protein HDU76_001328, partial [Blyttiomyces sp. JEL0837]